MEENIEDPRILLSKSLQKKGIAEKDSIIIALDAGSSQVIVDSDYVKNNFNFSKEIEIKILNAVKKFYAGYFYVN